jgi:hypothetical protein
MVDRPADRFDIFGSKQKKSFYVVAKTTREKKFTPTAKTTQISHSLYYFLQSKAFNTYFWAWFVSIIG